MTATSFGFLPKVIFRLQLKRRSDIQLAIKLYFEIFPFQSSISQIPRPVGFSSPESADYLTPT
jgi:hypothetical protein